MGFFDTTTKKETTNNIDSSLHIKNDSSAKDYSGAFKRTVTFNNGFVLSDYAGYIAAFVLIGGYFLYKRVK